jgi:hypothetical protein
MNITKSLGKLAAVITLALSAFGSANAAVTTIASGMNGASLVTIGGTVSATTIQYRAGTSGPYGRVATTNVPGVSGPAATGPQNPFAVNPGAGYAAALPGSEWLSPYEVTATKVPSSVAAAGYYDYKTRFNVGANQGLSGKFLSDDSVVGVLIDGHAISFTNGSPSWSSPGTFGFASGAFSAGVHTLEFIVFNATSGTTGLDFKGVLSPEPATIVAFAIAFLCIGAMMVRARKRETSSIVTA